MRKFIVASLACLLSACAGLPPASATCQTVYQCEIEGYARAR